MENKKPNKEEIKKALNKKKSGIETYIYLMKNLHKCDVSKCEIYQKKFRNFYRMNRLSKKYKDKFYKEYFKYLEENKLSLRNLNEMEIRMKFHEILELLLGISNRVEASFSSKLLATINCNLPVWDSKVRNQLDIKDKKRTIDETIDEYFEMYDRLKNEYLVTDEYIKIFDEVFPNESFDYEISSMKKVDLILWSLPKKNSSNK